MPLPRDNVTLEDMQRLNCALLESGARISEINIVRKHISAFKGGWLAKKAYPATLLNLVLSDVVGDRIYQQILSYRSFPEDKFAGSEEFKRMMEELLSHPR